MKNVLAIFIVSGKRHSGKDTFSLRLRNLLIETTGKNAVFWSGSVVLKQEYCRHAGLDLDKMLTDRQYKEEHRAAMIEYFRNTMSPDHCNVKIIEEMSKIEVPTYFVFDIRYELEIDCYVRRNLTPNLVKIRIDIEDETRIRRGWQRNPTIDEDVSEIDLDNYAHWDRVFDNNCDGLQKMDDFISNLIDEFNIFPGQ